MREPEKGDVEWVAQAEGGIEFYQPDAEKTEIPLIKDVLDANKKKLLKEFTLTFNKLDQVFGVDLKTGEFIFNKSLKIDLAPEVPKCNLRLIYYLRHRGRSNFFSFTETKFNLYRYLLGWQTTCDGRNIQRFLAIDPETGKTELMSKR